MLSDRHNNFEHLHEEAPIYPVFPIISKTTLDSFLDPKNSELGTVPLEEHRPMRSHYFVDHVRGKSTTEFISAVDTLNY